MRHDVKYTQSHSAPIRQRTGSMSDLNEHNYRYHHGNHYRSNGINGYSASNVDVEHGGTVSALSGGESHESQKQWDWLEDVLAKSSRNKETVRIQMHICYLYFVFTCCFVYALSLSLSIHIFVDFVRFCFDNPFVKEKKFVLIVAVCGNIYTYMCICKIKMNNDDKDLFILCDYYSNKSVLCG